MREIANKLLTKGQSEAIRKYIEAVCEIQGVFVKKHFSMDVNLPHPSYLKLEIWVKNKVP